MGYSQQEIANVTGVHIRQYQGDRQSLQDRESSVFDFLQDKLTIAFYEAVVCCIHESAGDVEETVTSLIPSNPTLFPAFQAKTSWGYGAIGYVHTVATRLPSGSVFPERQNCSILLYAGSPFVLRFLAQFSNALRANRSSERQVVYTHGSVCPVPARHQSVM